MALNALARSLNGFQHVSNTAINLASASSLTVVPALSGKSFFPRAALMIIASESGNATPPTVKVQAGGVDISDATAVGTSSHTVGDIVEIPLFPAGTHATNRLKRVDISSTGIVFVVTSPADGVLTAYPIIEGYLY